MDATAAVAGGHIISEEPGTLSLAGAAVMPVSMGPSQANNLAVCPPGMEILLTTSMLIVRQQVELLEVFNGIDTNNRYEILDMGGRRMFLAAEQFNCCYRAWFCGSRRPFMILILNNMGGVSLKVHRVCGCTLMCCGGCCCNEVRVYTANDIYLGKIIDKICDCICPRFGIFDKDNNEVLTITGPCNCCMCCSVHFTVRDMDGKEVGEIHKRWGGFAKEAFTTADTFGVSFPLDMDPRLKTLMIGAVFLIDFMYFEHDSGEHNTNANRIH